MNTNYPQPPAMPPPPSASALGAQPGYGAPVTPLIAPTPPWVEATQPVLSAPQADPSRVKTGLGRFHFFYVLSRNAKGKQTTAFLIPKTDVDTYNRCNAAVEAAIVKKWGAARPAWVKHPIKDGDLVVPNQRPVNPEFNGYWYFNATGKAQNQIRILDSYGHEILDPRAVSWGDWGRLSLTFYGSDKDNNVAVFIELNSAVWYQKGESLHRAGPPAPLAEEEFAADFQIPPAGYVPPAAYAPPLIAPQAGQVSTPAMGVPVSGFAPAPAAPVMAYAAPAPIQMAPVYAPPPPAPPQQIAPAGPPPGAPISPDGQFWWNASANQWVHL